MRSSNGRLSVIVSVPGARRNTFSSRRLKNVASWKRKSLRCYTLLAAPLNTSLPPARNPCPLSRPPPLPLPNVKTVSPPGGPPPRIASHQQRSSLPHSKSSKTPRRKKSAKRKNRRNLTRTRSALESGPAHRRTGIATQLFSVSPRLQNRLRCTRQPRRRLRRPPEVRAFHLVSPPA